MADFTQFLVSGVALGALYGLIALGFVVIFKATGILNFAHGAMVLIGAYLVARLAVVSFWAAIAVGIVATVLFALAIERMLVRSMAGRSVIAITIMTIGLDVIVLTLARSQVNTQILPTRDPWGSAVVHLGPAIIPLSRLVAVLVAGIAVAGFFLWFNRSAWGIAFRAATEKREVAPLMGIRLNRLSAVAWGVAGMFAVIAGVFLATFPSAGVSVDLSTVALRAFPAAIIGGLDSVHGAIVGGLVVGVAEIMAQGYQSHLAFLGGGFHEVLTYALMILVLLFRPAGFFGTAEVNRA